MIGDKEFLAAAIDLVSYDQETGVFRWLVSRRGVARAGDVAGSVMRNGYARIKINQKAVLSHRMAWLFVHGTMPVHQIDHINGDKLDNRIVNLRDVRPAVNTQNSRKARRRKNGGTMLGAHWATTWNRWKS